LLSGLCVDESFADGFVLEEEGGSGSTPVGFAGSEAF
jgi:hypothetical protein